MKKINNIKLIIIIEEIKIGSFAKGMPLYRGRIILKN
jgi:hypothetical protein